MKRTIAVVIAALVLAAIPALGQKQFKVSERVKLGGDGGWDYLTYDQDGGRLFITRGSHVMVIDAKTLKLAGDIPDLSGIHGVALAPESNRGFVSNGGDNTVTIFDLKTLSKLDSVKVGERPDAILYDPFSKRVFTFNARSHDSTAIDAASSKVAGTIPLGGKPEFPASDGQGKVYVNIEDKSQIAEIDVTRLAVLNTWSIAPCEEPSALALRKAPSSLRRVWQQDDGRRRFRFRQSRNHGPDRRRCRCRTFQSQHAGSLYVLRRRCADHHPRGHSRQVHRQAESRHRFWGANHGAGQGKQRRLFGYSTAREQTGGSRTEACDGPRQLRAVGGKDGIANAY